MSSAPDWGIGAYEVFAPSLSAAAEHLVELAAPRPGERAVDLGCGTGNATLPLLQAGATVTAVDPSLRLLGLAAARAAAADHQLASVVAGAESLPLPDGDADLIVSNFGMIFCPDAPAAFAETTRVLAPNGRLLYTAWLPTGAIADVATVMREATGTKTQPSMPPVARDVEGPSVLWHDPATFADLVPGGSDAVTLHHAEAVFSAESSEAWFTEQEIHHPMWLLAQQSLPDSTWASIHHRAVAILDAASPADQPFEIRSPYVVVEIRPRQ
ncbi:MAG: methyltransferase domain-containing protein [Solirubrobacteraceae bacterium]|nr:methyltransferase domain-containing protein [Solirubrobacteraceae bacterium]